MKVRAKKGKAGAIQDIASLIENNFYDKKTRKFQSGIVYCLSQKECDDTAAELSSKVRNLSCRPYHAGLSGEERSTTQRSWIQDKVKVTPGLVISNSDGLLLRLFVLPLLSGWGSTSRMSGLLSTRACPSLSRDTTKSLAGRAETG